MDVKAGEREKGKDTRKKAKGPGVRFCSPFPLVSLPCCYGWGTWIRTKVGGVRVRSPTARRSPNDYRAKGKDTREKGASASYFDVFKLNFLTMP